MPRVAKSQRMSLLAELAQAKEEKASEQLRMARSRLDEAQAQLDSLQEYRSNSLSKQHAGSAINSVNKAFVLTANLNFIAQIDQAIAQQEQVVEKVREQFQRVLMGWVELREKQKTLENLAERARRDEQAAKDKKEEQRQVDDFISAKYRRG